MSQGTLFEELQEQRHRAHPEELWAALRKQPVSRQGDDTWLVTGYDEVVAITQDPRITVDPQRAAQAAREAAAERGEARGAEGGGGESFLSSFVVQDPPDHERDRSVIMRQFGPPHRPGFVAGLEQSTYRATHSLLDGIADGTRMDVVEDLTYPLPVSVICQVLGVPFEDEPRFSRWTAQIAKLASPVGDIEEQDLQEIRVAVQEAMAYLMELVERRKTDPGDDMISGMVHDTPRGGRLPDHEIASNSVVLLIGGHETTVNAMASGVLLLLRHPEKMELLRERPELMAGAFEEILRLEPPLQFRDRVALADIELGGTTIPRGSNVVISYAATNRDPRRFRDPDVFDPQREDNQHTSFNLGIHYCFGAPLARLEGRVFLDSWLRRVRNPRLVEDPPPYRPSATLRGPRHLLVDHDGILPAGA